MNHAALNICPPAEQLTKLVTGSLMEAAAEQLFKHIESCPECQAKVDELSVRDDDVIAIARQGNDEGSSEDAGLSKLIRRAQQMPSSDDTQISSRSTTQAVSAVDFVDGLRRSGLMPGEELNQFLSDYSFDQSGSDSDSSTLARALIENRKLTPFQARLLLRGRWKGLVLGNYAILERLGQGGMGSVFKARHTRMGRIVCLKVVNSAGRQSQAVIDRFRNEARALAALSHPNIVVAHDADEAKGVPYLVMEFIDGDDLAKYVRASEPLSAKDALEVGVQTAQALHYAHGQGVIHRDVKPHNIVATRDAKTNKLSVKVLDLGLARFDSLITDNPDASVLAAMTNTGVVIGTVDYMSPEQALDSRNADARSDIYSLGCTLFFLLTGHAPFPGETVMQRLVAHREQPAPELWQRAGVSIDIEAVVHKMLAKRPEERYQSMQEVLDELRLLQNGQIPKAASESKKPAPTAAPLAAPITPAQPVAHGQPASAVQPAAVETAHPATPPVAYADAPTTEMNAVPAAMDLEFDVPASPVAKPKTRRKRRVKMLEGNGVTAIALLAIAVMAVLAAPLWDRYGPRVGGDRAMRNGGDGRALIIVGSDWFPDDQYTALTKRLQSRNVDVVTASPRFGTGQTEHRSDLRAPFGNINLANARPSDFDAIFVVGGTCGELIHQQKEVRSEMVRIVDGAMQHHVVLTGCQEGWDVIHKTEVFKSGKYKDGPKYKTHSADELASKAITIFEHLSKKQSDRG